MKIDRTKILVTGSSGTIGTALCETLLSRGFDVVGVDIKPNYLLARNGARKRKELDGNGSEFIEGLGM